MPGLKSLQSKKQTPPAKSYQFFKWVEYCILPCNLEFNLKLKSLNWNLEYL